MLHFADIARRNRSHAPDVDSTAQSPASAQQLVLAERDRLAERSQKLAADGDLTGAIQAAQAMLAIERRVLPEGHPDQTGSLEWLAGLYEQQDDFTQAVAMRRELLAIMRRSLPDDDWHVTDAKLALADTQGRAHMSPADRPSSQRPRVLISK